MTQIVYSKFPSSFDEFFQNLLDEFPAGRALPKVQNDCSYIIRGYHPQKDEIQYEMPNHKNPNSTYVKSVNRDEWRIIYNYLTKRKNTTFVTRDWLQETFPEWESKTGCEGSCNYGFVLAVLLELANRFKAKWTAVSISVSKYSV